MTKIKKDTQNNDQNKKGQTIMYKTPHRKLKNSSDRERYAVPAPLVASVKECYGHHH